MRNELNEAMSRFLSSPPDAYCFLYGSADYPDLAGTAYLYSLWGGSLILADVNGLPYADHDCTQRLFGFHVHEGSSCTGKEEDPFADTREHYNPKGCPHPEHAGDLPPLLGNQGYALSLFFTDAFYPEEVIGRTLVIHEMPDDLHSQPSGASGRKIGCGVIQENSISS